jgi:predicted ATPase/DNA-binding SARP family transcriptional activator
MIKFRLLGRFDIERDGARVEIRSRPAQSLLAFLLLHPGTPFRREMIAGVLWPEASETNARTYLRQALWRIRKAIEADDKKYIAADEITIAFRADPQVWIDAAVLQTEAGPDSSAEDLIGDISVYQGELLPGFYEDWVGPERERLRSMLERRMTLLLDRLLENRRWQEVLTWGERWITLAHAPEPAYRALMIAHNGLGDPAAVARAFQRCADGLQRDLGVEPSPATRELYESLMKARGAPAPGPREAERSTSGNLPGNLAAHEPLTPFIGRERERQEIAAILSNPSCRLLTLTGPGGVGKTRLALRAAMDQMAAFTDGAFFVPLAPLISGQFLVSSLAESIGFTFYGAEEAKEQLLAYLADKRILLVLDNFEHLLVGIAGADETATALLIRLLSKAPGAKLIITSRERLRLSGEWLLEIQGMGFPEDEEDDPTGSYAAVELFLQSARRIQAGFELSAENRPLVVRICKQVGGMPLGIELAAAWLRSLSLADIARETEHDVDLLASPLRDTTERHRSLGAAFEHSWKLLSDREKKAFSYLSVFRGEFSREEAESVAQVDLSLLAILVDKSLVRMKASGRYELHEVLRQYAQQKLEEAGEALPVRRRHRDWYLALAEEAEPGLWGAGDANRRRQLELEQDNLRAALEWSRDNGEAEEMLRLASALRWFWYIRAQFEEGFRWLQSAVALPGEASTLARAKALVGAGVLAEQRGDFAQAVPLLKEAMPLWGQLGLNSTGWTLLHLGLIALLQGDYDQAKALYSESLRIFEESEDREGIASMLMYLGNAARHSGDNEKASVLLEQSLPLLTEVGDDYAVSRALCGMGIVAMHRGDHAKAAELIEQSLTMSIKGGDRVEVAECLEGLAYVACAQSRLTRSARLLGAAESLRLAIATPLARGIRSNYDATLSALTSQLGKAEFASAWEQGRRMTMDQAVHWATDL